MGWNKFLCLMCTLFVYFGCASYTDDTQKVRALLSQERYVDALESYSKSKSFKREENAVLTGMEMGMLHYLTGNYLEAAKTWRKSLDTAENLYTVSVSREAKGFLISDDRGDYLGETHERILLPVFSAMSYLFAGFPDKTLNETRRLLELFKSMEADGIGPDAKRDRLAHYLAAFAFELQGDQDGALIEYRASLGGAPLGGESQGWASHVGREVYRLAQERRRGDILGSWKGEPPVLSPSSWADVLVLTEVGTAPIKVPEELLVPTGKTLVRVSFPVYKRISRVHGGVHVRANGANAPSFLAMDLEALAEQSLSRRRGRDLSKMAARLFLKDQSARAANRALGPLAGLGVNILASVTETADTRSWTTLPASVHVARIKVAPGPSRFQMSAGGKTKVQEVHLKPGEKRILRFHIQ